VFLHQHSLLVIARGAGIAALETTSKAASAARPCTLAGQHRSDRGVHLRQESGAKL
jgi:hypothetical protein